MFAILLGVFIIVLSFLPKATFYRSHGPGLAKYDPPIEPRWVIRLVLFLFGLAAILDGIWDIRHD
jgi:hypothetical protein